MSTMKKIIIFSIFLTTKSSNEDFWKNILFQLVHFFSVNVFQKAGDISRARKECLFFMEKYP